MEASDDRPPGEPGSEESASPRELAERVRLLNERLNRCETAFREFLYAISHDLRAPLRGIRSIIGWLEEDYGRVLTGDGLTHLHDLQEQGRLLQKLLEAVLRLSRVDRHREVRESFHSGEHLETLIADRKLPKGVRIILQPPFPTLVYDLYHFGLIVDELIDNALRFLGAPRGTVTISCESAENHALFHVQDTGIGIEAKHFERVFRLFQTLDPEPNLDHVGMGLSMVKRLVERYGGEITVSSTPGRGSRFSFQIPRPLTVGES